MTEKEEYLKKKIKSEFQPANRNCSFQHLLFKKIFSLQNLKVSLTGKVHYSPPSMAILQYIRDNCFHYKRIFIKLLSSCGGV